MSENPEFIYARDSLRILGTSLELVKQGRLEFYRVAALQLRLLLCDTTRRHNQVVNISLSKRLWPDLHLHPLNSGGSFDPGLEPIPLTDWLAQRLPSPSGEVLTLRELIRRVCDQEGGAHVDLKPESSLPGLAEVIDWVSKAGAETLGAITAQKKSIKGR